MLMQFGLKRLKLLSFNIVAHIEANIYFLGGFASYYSIGPGRSS